MNALLVREKRSFRLSLALITLILPALACQAASGFFQKQAADGRITAESQLSRASVTPAPSITPTITPSPPPPSATPTKSHTPTPTVTPAAWQSRVFEKLWQTVLDEYLYADFNGLNWHNVGQAYRQRVQAGMTEADFYAAMDEMIRLLGDEHSVFLDPVQAKDEDAEFAGKNDYVGIGVLTNVVPERQRVEIILVFPGSPAEQVGLAAHDSILAVDGVPIVDENGFHRELLRGAEGTSITLTVQTPGEPARAVKVTRRRITGAVPVPHTLLTTPNGERAGYILLATFADDTIDEQVEAALREMSNGSALDGVILDNRQNGGGADVVARGVLSYFTHGVLGHFVNRNQEQRAFSVKGVDVNGSSRLPLVVLVGPNTASFGEIFSGVLADIGRAYLIGQPTEGNVELLRGYDFEDGSRAWLAYETFRPRVHPEQNWEATGIIPHQIVVSNWDEVLIQTDPVIQAALDYIDATE